MSHQLNADLVALGDASTAALDPSSDYFSAATATALDKLQADLGVTQTGRLTLGQAVFLPTAARVTSVAANLGGAGPARRDGPAGDVHDASGDCRRSTPPSSPRSRSATR